LLPAFRYVAARVTEVAPIVDGLTTTPLASVIAQALHSEAPGGPVFYFSTTVPVVDAPAPGAVVWFRTGGVGDVCELVTRRPPIVHAVKCQREPFEAVRDGRKKHETRVDDRDYRVGDTIELWEIETGGVFTGNRIRRRITYKSEGGTWGLPPGLCVLSVEPIEGEP
jgi:hypothetical protein